MIISGPPKLTLFEKYFQKDFLKKISKKTLIVVSIFGISLLLFSIFLSGVTLRDSFEAKLASLSRNYGFYINQSKGTKTELKRLLSLITDRVLNPKVSKSTSSKIPLLSLNIKFKHLHKIYHKRQEALKIGKLLKYEKDYIPVSLKFNDQKIKAKIRLRGQRLAENNEKKWSYQIKLDEGKFILGMNAFSIHHPKVKHYQNEFLGMSFLRDKGILTPRLKIVKVEFNGEDFGLYTLEEHFTKGLLESQRRFEGPILKIDDSMAIRSVGTGTEQIYPADRLPLIPFNPKQFKENPKQQDLIKLGTGMFRSFLQGDLTIEEVFDLEKVATFLAVTELLDSLQAQSSANLRLYFNPLLKKFEPIAYRLDIHPHETPKGGMLQTNSGANRFFNLSDPRLGPLFFQKLHEFANEILTNKWKEHFTDVQSKQIGFLLNEFPLVERYPYEKLIKRAKQVLRTNYANKGDMPRTEMPESTLPYPRILNTFVITQNNEVFLEVQNLLPYSVVLSKTTLIDESKIYHHGQTEQNIEIPPTPLGQYPKSVFLKLSGTNSKSNSPRNLASQSRSVKVITTSKIKGGDQIWKQKAIGYYPPIKKSKQTAGQLNDLLKRYHFFKYFKETQELKVLKGQWKIDQFIEVPMGLKLKIDPGTTMKFDQNAGLFVNGPISAVGTKSEPIKFLPLSQDWKGMAIFNANEESQLEHVIIKSTTGVKYNGLSLTGGASFYQSDLYCDHCQFDTTSAEDALNIINGHFVLSNSKISNTRSDAFDGDFVQGVVIGSSFSHIGGDAIDYSGSKVLASNSHFYQVQDKAISIGEDSQFFGNHLTVKTSGTGLACKDQSQATIENSTFKNMKHVAMMSYIKKPEFGPASLNASKIRFSKNAKNYLNQTGSSFTLEGRKVAEEDINIEELYKSGYMRK